VGNDAPSSYIPDLNLGYIALMNFYQRFMNVLMNTYGILNVYLTYLPGQETIYTKYFGHSAPRLYDVLSNTSLLFTNDHFSLTAPRPLAANVIPLGGIHVPPKNPLPKVLPLTYWITFQIIPC